MTKEDAMKTPEWRWLEGRWSFGSFKTHIMRAMQVADGFNLERLEMAFPHEVAVYKIWMGGEA